MAGKGVSAPNLGIGTGLLSGTPMPCLPHLKMGGSDKEMDVRGVCQLESVAQCQGSEMLS